MYRLSLLILLLLGEMSRAQDLDSLMSSFDNKSGSVAVKSTFKAARVVNMQTTEQIKGRELEFNIAHRFDNIGGESGGFPTFYGIDNARDIRLALSYGINNRWLVGIARSKGAYLRRQIVDLNTKVKLLQQKSGQGSPVSLSLYGSAEVSTMKSSSDTLSIAYYKLPAHRINYVSQALLSRKFSDRFSFLIAPTVVYRNLVHYTQKNFLFALGGGFRFLITKRIGIVADYYHVFDRGSIAQNFMSPLALGLEFETGGHVFHLVFSNNASLLESQFLTQTTENWLKGQVRLGFNISRVFSFR
jgi:hypothetical protein